LGKSTTGQAAASGKCKELIQRFDYIIAGAGCAGLSLLMRMLEHPYFKDKKILLADKGPKNDDDRTWCFWENDNGFFEPVVHHTWPHLWIKHLKGDLELALDGYKYKMIRGIDFYTYCFRKIEQDKRIEIVYGDISDVDAALGQIHLNGTTYQAEWIFSSLPKALPPPKKNEFFLLQHFRGWWIETSDDFFDPNHADLMNFRVSQAQGCTFVYVMPVSPRKALIEYTLFSENKLTQQAYDNGLLAFIQEELKPGDYTITDTEEGIIPMTNQPFSPGNGKTIHLGTSGGRTKGSTGYTFQNIQKHSEQIIQTIVTNKMEQAKKASPARFSFYDGVLLRVLSEKKISGADVFFRLFRLNPAPRILRFLDNESTLPEELIVMMTSPKWPFFKAALKQMW
jgi:lycopene beta-cyclase